MAKWLDELFSLNKEASQTDATQEFTKKIKSSGWVNGIMGISEEGLKKEEEAKIQNDLAIRAELQKTAGYDAFETTEETLKHDMKRDVEILSDFTLASMVAEMRGHKKQDFMENATKYFEEAKKDVAKDRKAVEKELLDGTGLSAQLDTFKAFADYKKDEKPAEPKEADLYIPKLKDVNDDLSKGGKVDAYAETDEQHAKTMQGVGREADERIDVTQQAGEVHKDASLVRDPDVEIKVGTLFRLARSIMTHEGVILAEGTNWEVLGTDGNRFIIGANGQKHAISTHDSPKFDTIKKNASQEEIVNHATKAQIIEKLAEIKSPWAIVEKDGQEVIARISDESVVKESEEDNKDLSK